MTRNKIYELEQHVALALMVMVLIGIACYTARAQSYLNLTDEQKVGLCVNRLQTSLQRSQPGEVRSFAWGELSIDGKLMRVEELYDTLDHLISAARTRSGYVSNPAPGRLGPFWDFEIIDAPIAINGTQCNINCTFRLMMTGEKLQSGLIELEYTSDQWRIKTINGLLPLLSTEILSMDQRRAIPMQRQPAGKTLRKK